jgi:hypothetical protein
VTAKTKMASPEIAVSLSLGFLPSIQVDPMPMPTPMPMPMLMLIREPGRGAESGDSAAKVHRVA